MARKRRDTYRVAATYPVPDERGRMYGPGDPFHGDPDDPNTEALLSRGEIVKINPPKPKSKPQAEPVEQTEPEAQPIEEDTNNAA